MILPACLTPDKSILTIKKHKAFLKFSTRFDAKVTEHKELSQQELIICIKINLSFMWSFPLPPHPHKLPSEQLCWSH